MDTEDWKTLGISIAYTISAILIAVGFLLFLYWITGGNQAHDAFMAECLQYRKQYECTAMWRAGETNTTVIPMYTGR